MSTIHPGIGDDIPESSSTPSRKSIPAPSFKFFVASEEGIHLFVDMDSSSLDWHKRFRNKICTCHCLQSTKFQSFREEVQYLGSKFEQRKSLFVSDTNSCTKLNCGYENFDSGQYSVVNDDDSSSFSYPETKNEDSEILAPKRGSYFCNVSEYLEHEDENSITSCLNSVASEILVDVNSSLRHEEMKILGPNSFHDSQGKVSFRSTGLMVGDGSETLVDGQDVMLLNKNPVKGIEKDWNFGENKPFIASSSISETDILLSGNGNFQKDASHSLFTNEDSHILIDKKAPLNSSYGAQARHRHVTGTTSSLKLQKSTEKLKTGGGYKRKRQMSQCDTVCGQYSGRILRSAKSRKFYPRKCKLQKFKVS